MFIPDPYFYNVPSIGNIKLVDIMLSETHPILFVGQAEDRLFIGICRSVTEKQKWALYETNEQILKEFKNGTIDLKQAIKAYPAGTSVVILWDKEIIKENYRVFVNVAHDVDSLPDNFFLEKEEEE